ITPQEAFVFEQGEIPSYDALTASQIKNIKKLFESECEIIITAGNPGKNTWATPYGSMFTNCFLRSMTEHFDMPQAKAKKVSWDNLLNQAKVYTYNMTKTTRIKYYPVWEKRNCNGLVEQSLTDTSNVVQRDVTLNIATKKTWRF